MEFGLLHIALSHVIVLYIGLYTCSTGNSVLGQIPFMLLPV